MRGYAICCEPRSGSVLLCQMLRSTGALGMPTEYFNSRAVYLLHGIADHPLDPEEQLAAIPKLGATPNGVYGLKVFSKEFDKVKDTRWAKRLPSLSFIRLVRNDALGQAISQVRANQTLQWMATRDAKGEPAYDFAAITNRLLNLLHAENRWRYFLARNDLPVLHLTYEHICEHPEETVAAVGRQMNLGEPPRLDMSKVNVTVQRDSLSAQWRARYLAQSRDLTRFD